MRLPLIELRKLLPRHRLPETRAQQYVPSHRIRLVLRAGPSFLFGRDEAVLFGVGVVDGDDVAASAFARGLGLAVDDVLAEVLGFELG